MNIYQWKLLDSGDDQDNGYNYGTEKNSRVKQGKFTTVVEHLNFFIRWTDNISHM